MRILSILDLWFIFLQPSISLSRVVMLHACFCWRPAQKKSLKMVHHIICMANMTPCPAEWPASPWQVFETMKMNFHFLPKCAKSAHGLAKCAKSAHGPFPVNSHKSLGIYTEFLWVFRVQYNLMIGTSCQSRADQDCCPLCNLELTWIASWPVPAFCKIWRKQNGGVLVNAYLPILHLTSSFFETAWYLVTRGVSCLRWSNTCF